ncbi:hypothetical protein PybrP1_006244 [[Pythium] brassicae (nom. inval.)]|nr:hypothetical protein PybrP1_006244 [[Pythium] brassicae (nom. inval.)]
MAAPDADAARPDSMCEWCGEAPWTFRCATCDPRREKRAFEAWAAEAKARFDASRSSSGAKALSNGSDQLNELQQQEHQEQEQIIVDSPDASDASAGYDDTEEEERHAGKSVSLEQLLASLPSDELPLLDALSEFIHAALRVQDGLACVRFGKCAQPECVRTVEITRHNTNGDAPCGDDCRVGLEMYQHMRACTQPGCPFCVRVRLRKELNSIRAIESLITKQKLAMRHWLQAHKDGARDAAAKFNFCASQVKEYERKRLLLVDQVDEMNSLVLRLRLPIFNFPQPAWHIDSEPPIKTESMPSPSKTEAPSASAQPERPAEPPSEEAAACEAEATVEEAAAAPADEATELTYVDPDDYICMLLQAKDDNPVAQRQYDEAVKLAFAIVEASFCTPAKSPRCVLKCQEILSHLQHHLDLNVCEDVLCMTVEFHFAHLSMCMQEGESDACEYCLRVKEREMVRSLDLMDGELHEATVKAQAVVDEITASFANDSRREHEAALAQLEDELEQAEEYKRDSATKLSASRRDLRDLRERMKALAVPTSVLEPLPPHFVKAAKKDGSASKRRKW